MILRFPKLSTQTYLKLALNRFCCGKTLCKNSKNSIASTSLTKTTVPNFYSKQEQIKKTTTIKKTQQPLSKPASPKLSNKVLGLPG
jgi:hypothetical protein